VEKGFAEADVVLEESYRTESELQTHGTSGSPQSGIGSPHRMGVDPESIRSRQGLLRF
jgi:hypothetical protein